MANTISYWQDQWEKDVHGGQYSDQKVAQFITRLMGLSRRRTLLDVGCAGGLLLKNLPAQKKVGLDYAKSRIKEARKNVPDADFHVGEAAELPFGDESFDDVLCHSIFMHFDDRYAERVVCELERVCKKDGCILVGDVPDVDVYPFGRYAYYARSALLDFLGKPHYLCHTKEFFVDRGYRVSQSPFNRRFYAYKTKT